MNNELRRQGDLADLPRQLVWLIISVKEVGIHAVVIGALLFICFISQNRMTEAFTKVAVVMGEQTTMIKNVIENQHMIIRILERK